MEEIKGTFRIGQMTGTHLFALALSAENKQLRETCHMAELVCANSEAEARAIGFNIALEHWPTQRGWAWHYVACSAGIKFHLDADGKPEPASSTDYLM